MPATFDGLGIECIYPENWVLTRDYAEDELIGFTIDSPDAAFFSLARYPWTAAPRQVLEETLPALESIYQQVESRPIEPDFKIADARALEANFYCLDLLVTSRMVAFTVRPYTYLVQMQAEDRIFERLEPVLRAMLVSVLRSLSISA